MFGFWGIVLGPVLMIIIVTTISVYLAVYKGAPLDDQTDEDETEAQVALAMAAVKPSAVTQEPDRRGRALARQPLLEELDDPLARLVGRLAVHLADLHR